MRLSNMLLSVVSLVAGAIISFYFSWQMALFSLVSASTLLFAQMFIFNLLQRKGRRDVHLTDDLGRISTEAIEYQKTVQALTRETTFLSAFNRASEAPTKAALIRGLLWVLKL
jgi:ABC-type bacteriocin/lantibiotic exporter with double-glycine peptidase domain